MADPADKAEKTEKVYKHYYTFQTYKNYKTENDKFYERFQDLYQYFDEKMGPDVYRTAFEVNGWLHGGRNSTE